MAIPFHLADRALTPIISSSRSSSSNHNLQMHTQAQAMSSLTSTAVTAFDTASRLGLGLPQRIMIESQSSGPIILHSFLNTPSLQQTPASLQADHAGVQSIVEHAQEDLRPLSGTTDIGSLGEHVNSSRALVNGVPESAEDTEETSAHPQPPPLLIASAVARSAALVGDARRVAARLEQTGRVVQREWTREHEESVVADGQGG